MLRDREASHAAVHGVAESDTIEWLNINNKTKLFIACFLKIFFDVDHFKVFIEFVTVLLLFYVLFVLAMRHVGS